MIMDEKKYDYYSYIVLASGHIYNAFGREINVRRDGTVRLQIDGKPKTIIAGKIIYEVVTGKKITLYDENDKALGKKNIIGFRDGNRTNIAFDNIVIVSREDYFKEKEWAGQKLSREDKKQLIYDYTHRKIESHGKRSWGNPSNKDLKKKYGISESLFRNTLIKAGVYQKPPVEN